MLTLGTQDYLLGEGKDFSAEKQFSPEFIRSIFDYDPVSGFITWKIRSDVPEKVNKRFAGKRAGCKTRTHRAVGVRYVLLPEHRVCWCIYYGEWPTSYIDHKDRNGFNNAISNLRLADKSANSVNRDVQPNNTSGVRGVYWCKQKSKWHARIKVKGKYFHVGFFDCLQKAKEAFDAHMKSIHGEFYFVSTQN